LSRCWCDWKSLLLDDPVQHIDYYRALNLVEVLAAIRRIGRQVIIVVEDVALADLLCRRLLDSEHRFYQGARHGLEEADIAVGTVVDDPQIAEVVSDRAAGQRHQHGLIKHQNSNKRVAENAADIVGLHGGRHR
jgi:chromosome segregation protein